MQQRTPLFTHSCSPCCPGDGSSTTTTSAVGGGGAAAGSSAASGGSDTSTTSANMCSNAQMTHAARLASSCWESAGQCTATRMPANKAAPHPCSLVLCTTHTSRALAAGHCAILVAVPPEDCAVRIQPLDVGIDHHVRLCCRCGRPPLIACSGKHAGRPPKLIIFCNRHSFASRPLAPSPTTFSADDWQVPPVQHLGSWLPTTQTAVWRRRYHRAPAALAAALCHLMLGCPSGTAGQAVLMRV
jgi:hypothetical protein